ncbi:MAG: hypothetical protein WAV85_15285 [Rhodoferax sp.]
MTNNALFYDLFQYVTVAVLVAGCALYCVLTLAPTPLKEPLRDALHRLPLPKMCLAKLSQSRAAGACGSSCSGCSVRAANSTQQVHLQPRKR